MRKRIVIRILGIITVGVLVFVLSQPKKGSVEWHKRKHLAASQGPLTTQIQNLWNRVRGSDERYGYGFDDEQKTHQQTLIDLGYLQRREFVFTNRSVDDVPDEAMLVHKWYGSRPDSMGCFRSSLRGPASNANLLRRLLFRSNLGNKSAHCCFRPRRCPAVRKICP
jgi:hypothetical protein